jgi:hypothetical protein
MMDRDTVQSEENQAGLRRREAMRASWLIGGANAVLDYAQRQHREAHALSDELGEFCDAISSAIGRLEKAIEGDR